MRTSGLHFACGDYHVEIDVDGFKMTLAATYLVRLARAELQEVLSPLGLTDKIELVVVVLDDRPVRVIGTNGSLDLEPVRQLDEHLDVFALVSRLGKAALDDRLIL